MPGGINWDEQKRQQQFMVMQEQQKLEQNQKMDYSMKRKKRGNIKDMVVTVCIVLGLILVMILLNGR